MTAFTTDTTPETTRQPFSGDAAAGLIALGIIGYFAGATALFGLMGLAMAALSMVPVVWIALLLITVGK